MNLEVSFHLLDCTAGLGMESGLISNQDITASSSRSPVSTGNQARLHNPRSAWSPYPNDNNPYLQVYLGGNKKVTAISTQGHPLWPEFVRSYLVRYSINGKIWRYVKAINGVPKVSNIYFLLTESAVITGKYQTEVLAVRTEPVGRGSYIKDRGLIFSRNDQADEVNKKFIIWHYRRKKLTEKCRNPDRSVTGK